MVVSGLILLSSFAVREWTDTEDTVLSALPGMTSTPLTAVGNVATAVISRDGQSFAYAALKNGVATLWVQRVGGAHPIELRQSNDPGPRGLTFNPAGDRLLFSEDSALMEIPIGARAADRRLRSRIGVDFGLSPDGKQVAFVRLDRARRVWTLVVAALDSTIAEREVAAVALPQQFSEFGPAWSPDATTLVLGASSQAKPGQFALTSVRIADGKTEVLDPHRWDALGKVAWEADGQGILFQAVKLPLSFHIWQLALPSRALRRLTPGLTHYGRASVSLSDDGRSLLVVRSETNSGIWVAPSTDIGHAHPVTSHTPGRLDGNAGLAWMPDGRLVYSSLFSNGTSLWTMIPGRNAKPLTSPGFMDRFPQATSNGRFIVFESDRQGGSDVWRISADGSDLRRLTASDEDGQPSLTPDDRWVYYTDSPSEGTSVWRISIDGHSATKIGPVGSSWPRVSPDGRLLAYVSADTTPTPGARRLIVVSIDGQRPVAQFELARGGAVTNGLRWTPDGSALVYRNLSGGLWRQPISGEQPAKMPDVPDERISFFDWSIDGRTFAMSYGDEVREVVLLKGFK
jgi:Tol biopolymer transport system component